LESDSENTGTEDRMHQLKGSSTQKFLLRKAVKWQVNTLQIMTIPDGYNSGRTYYIRAKTENLCRKMTTDLNNLSNVAKERAVVKSRFQTVRVKVHQIHSSTAFQLITASLIVVVYVDCIILILSSPGGTDSLF
jgi:hypothetical protein